MSQKNITREELAAKAREMMKAHGLEEIFVCSDKQGFTEKERANDHSRYLSDKTVHRFTSDSVLIHEEGKKEPVNEAKETKTDEERQQLAQRYEELFGKKPNHMTGVEKLKSQIQEKETELASKSEETIQNTTQAPELPLDQKPEDAKEQSEQKSEENPAEEKED
ncbi:hypothetical protein HX001_17085 [Empedobacter brevis]|uniref:Uncharacterized protein n=1 Tax=Empedobacter brevis TaxID=247 RepID=A0AAJ1QHU4_9FLAO|nr:hypothetical protein [Empedobacter brevis]MDM1074202.1 hypothetical protein [Empedobacter brevis]